MKRLPKLLAFILTVPFFLITTVFVTTLWILGANNKRLLDLLDAIRDITDET